MMYKIFLVEDEPPILEMINGLIERGDYGFTVTGTAYNGRDALKLLPQNVPDVILTDIKMPFMDGLALIEEVHHVYPEIKTVILSGYSIFEYARTALRLKVYDYLLKPVHPDGLTAVLHSLREQLDREKSEHERACLNALIDGREPEEELLRPFPPLAYFPVLICAGSLSSRVYDIISPGREFWLKEGEKKVEAWGKALPADKFWLLNGGFPNEKIVFLGTAVTDHLQVIAWCRQLEYLLANGRITVNLIVGPPVQQISQIRVVLKEIRDTLKHQIVFGQAALFAEDRQADRTPPVGPEEEKRLAVLVQQTDFASFQKCLKVLFDEWREQDVTQWRLERLLDRLNEVLRGHCTLTDGPQFQVASGDLLVHAATYDELFQNCCAVYKGYYDGKADKQSMRTAKELVDQIEKYLIDHYHENFTYKTFYNLFGYNETYITNVFRNIKGISPSKFVTRLRIAKAKKMIAAEPDILLKTVAEMVGYDDPLYFSRVFKELTGVNPSEYLKQIKK